MNLNSPPSVQYDYADGAGGSGVAQYVRLSDVVYPNGRKVDYNYATGVDSIMSRFSTISDDLGLANGSFQSGTLSGSGWTVGGSANYYGVGGYTGGYYFYCVDPPTGETLSQNLAATVQAAGVTYTLTFTAAAYDGSYQLQPQLLPTVPGNPPTTTSINMGGPLSISGGPVTYTVSYTTQPGDAGTIGIQFVFVFSDGSDEVVAQLADVALSASVANYKYLGAGTIASEYYDLGAGSFAGNSYDDLQVGLDYSAYNFAGFDQFGRIADQVWAEYGSIGSGALNAARRAGRVRLRLQRRRRPHQPHQRRG